MEASQPPKLETVEETTEYLPEAENTNGLSQTEKQEETFEGESNEAGNNNDCTAELLAEKDGTEAGTEQKEELPEVNSDLPGTRQGPADEVSGESLGGPAEAEAETLEELKGDSAAEDAPTPVKEEEKQVVPSSEVLGEQEEEEGQQIIGELLSREGSPVAQQENAPLELELEAPERETSPTEEEEEEALSINYEEYMERYKELKKEKANIIQQSGQLQNKLVEYFRRKTGEEIRHEKEKPVSDQEQRYLKYMSTMEDLKWQHRRDSESYQQQIKELRAQSQEKVSQVDSEWKVFMGFKKEVAVSAMSRRLGKQAAVAQVEQIQANEQRKENELVQVRLENIKLKNKVRKFEAMLKAKEELAEGLHLIDFEQLKIENQTYNEKIEERNEELLKLRKKITSTVQVLTHVKEKLQFVQVENQAKKAQLTEVEALVARKRDILTKTKQARDALRTDNLKLRQKCGLLGNETLLRDFEEKVDASEALSQRLEMLRRRHAELTLRCVGLKRKLEQAKLSRQ
nr:PREDICTED: coiled-coil domain-containing protein 96 [Lepisosteus oculatus]